LSLSAFNSVAAAPVSKLTPDIHSNHAADVREKQQTYIHTTLGTGEATAVIMGVGQSVYLCGVLSYDTPAASSMDVSHGIPNATVYIQSMNSDGKTWITVATQRISEDTSQLGINFLGTFIVTLTPKVAGVYTYRVTYDGDSQYAPSVSNVVTLTVTNVVIS
jgi:hypothetical protein